MTSDEPISGLLDRFGQHDRRALSRLITLASRGEQIEALRSALDATSGTGDSASSDSASSDRAVIALTGSGGVGKSTLAGRLVELLRARDRRVAVLACDPQSPLTGGALLGDRIRMPSRPDDDGLFIRSLAVQAGHQAIADHLDLIVRLLQEFGFELVLLETVGAGQGDTAVRDVADVVVLLVQPEAGDDLQWEKAGVLEIADMVVVNKADLPGAERADAQLREMLNMPGCRAVPVLRASGARNEGLEAVWAAIESCST